MTLTKANIIESVREQMDFPKNDCIDVVEKLLGIMKKTLENGEDIMVSGFGKFRVMQKKQRKGRNPATDQEMLLDQRRVVTFRCSGVLRNKVNVMK
ncbi:integration host factor subunit alpha [Desulfococcaceae bacterium HSG9]|nr:integration host factor subunit alpha [Desulfococcaceae bacterium HSG9]